MKRTAEESWFSLGAIVLGVVATTLLAFYIANLGTMLVPDARYRAAIADAVQSGELDRRITLPLAPDEPVAVHNFNDCLILSMLLLSGEDSAVRRAISPRVPTAGTSWDGKAPTGYPPYVQCRDLKVVMDASTAPESSYYHRYLHGDWALVRLTLSWLSLAAATNLLMGAQCVVLVLLIVLAVRNVVRRQGDTGRDRAYAAIVSVLLLFNALPIFGWSFSFGPSDLVLSGFLLFFYLNPPSTLSERGFACACALFGTLTAMFEFFTGAAPGGAMALIAVVVFDGGDRRMLWRKARVGILCFGMAGVLSFALKMAVVAAIWGTGELGIFSRQLGAHMSSGGWDVAPENAARLARFGATPEVIRSNTLFSYVYALAKIVYFSRMHAYGSSMLAILLVLLLPLLLILRTLIHFRRSADPAQRLRASLLLTACAVMPAWYLAFLHHTIVHAHFMFRPMIWPLALMLAWALWEHFSLRERPSTVV